MRTTFVAIVILLFASTCFAGRDAQAEKFLNSAKTYESNASEIDLVQMWLEAKEIDHALYLVYSWSAKGSRTEWPVDLPKLNKIVSNRAAFSALLESDDHDVVLLTSFVRTHAQAAQFYMLNRDAFDRYQSFMNLTYIASRLRYVAERVQSKYGKGRKIIPPED